VWAGVLPGRMGCVVRGFGVLCVCCVLVLRAVRGDPLMRREV
jgi:hypothetical protein